jgi:hypothetical protein
VLQTVYNFVEISISTNDVNKKPVDRGAAINTDSRQGAYIAINAADIRSKSQMLKLKCQTTASRLPGS